MERNASVVYDSCVIYPASLRDLLLMLAGEAQHLNLFRAKWTADIHEEWIRSVLKNQPHLVRENLKRTRELMDQAVDDCLVTGYEHLIQSLNLPDPDDRHVLAAAIESGSAIIVTKNIKDFPDVQLQSCGVLAQHPDDFIMDFLATYEKQGEAVLEEAVRAIKVRLKNPPKTWTDYLNTLENVGLNRTVDHLKDLLPASEITENKAFQD